MGGVSIPAYVVEADGVKWTASWDDGGHISYKGIDKDGREVSSAAPSNVIKSAHDYGAGFGGKGGEEKTSNDFKDTCDGLIIETNKDGTLKSANISEQNWTPKQREFVENCLKAAAMKGLENAKEGKQDVEGSRLPDRNERSLKKELAKSFNQIAQGSLEALELAKAPIRTAQDLYKAGKLVAQGKFRELRDRAALRIHDNVEALGILSDNMQKRIDAANKRIEERLGIENREKNPSAVAKFYGRQFRAIQQLSGRGNQSEARPAVQARKINPKLLQKNGLSK